MDVSLADDPEAPDVLEDVPPDAVAVAVPAPDPSPPPTPEVADAESEKDENADDDASEELLHV